MLPDPSTSAAAGRRESTLRIIGGRLGGRQIVYTGDPRTRPMKDRVREAVFNLLGPSVKDKLALDLFAGTGALGFEAISRGAAHAFFYEQHFPTAAMLGRNLRALELEGQSQVIAANTLVQLRPPAASLPRTLPWLAFCSPPYAFYIEKREAMLELIGTLVRESPAESLIVVEADERFDLQSLPEASAWRARSYPPAEVAIFEKKMGDD